MVITRMAALSESMWLDMSSVVFWLFSPIVSDAFTKHISSYTYYIYRS